MVDFYEKKLKLRFRHFDYPHDLFWASNTQYSIVVHDRNAISEETLHLYPKTSISFLTPEDATPEGQPVRLWWNNSGTEKQIASRSAYLEVDPDGNGFFVQRTFLDRLQGPRALLASTRGFLRHFTSSALAYLRILGREQVETIFDRSNYRMNRVGLLSRDLRDFSHIVASREGLYAINRNTHRKIMRGQFFGITVSGSDILCFQANGSIGSTENRGRIIKLRVENSRIVGSSVCIRGLDDGCHQIDVLGNRLIIVDCYNAAILETDSNISKISKTHFPLGQLERDVAKSKIHMNSFYAVSDDEYWLLLHNKGNRSVVVRLNTLFEEVGRFTLDACWAHNIVTTNDDNRYAVADSHGSRLIGANGTICRTNGMLTRGISLSESECVIGESEFATQFFRRFVPGRVYFYEPATWKRREVLELPAAPTDIRRIDGEDYGLSNFNLRKGKTQFKSAKQLR